MFHALWLKLSKQSLVSRSQPALSTLRFGDPNESSPRLTSRLHEHVTVRFAGERSPRRENMDRLLVAGLSRLHSPVPRAV
ncbi:protein of unknown function (plasmid) [Pararobbsia alpina]